MELRTTDASEYELGQEVTVEAFEAGTVIDVTGDQLVVTMDGPDRPIDSGELERDVIQGVLLAA